MNLPEYFARIGYQGQDDKADVETLRRIHEQHTLAIPYENLSIHCGEDIGLDLQMIYDKIVKKKRGGWCTENNGLFYWVLKEMGYDVVMLGSQVYNCEDNMYSAKVDHLVLLTTIDNKPYLSDVGFGVLKQMRQPLELTSGKDQPQLPGVYRLTEENGVWELERYGRKLQAADESYANSSLFSRSPHQKMYKFTLATCTLQDFQDVNLELQTSPKSLFVNKSICAVQTVEGFKALIGSTYSEWIFGYREGEDLVTLTTVGKGDHEKILKEKFNILLEKEFQPVNNPPDVKGAP
ncbi:arylamine N-acetyltransferase, pineal gland isozyme NAT-10 [Callorhinchus milii]|uniref:arylamine N-acetyltransferase n=1 Tax=Callorhinchus milii TaxID=7868 RepID=V9KYW8_CALMI|nr:arylamine N-acetyltransferase, pineal gland isozyme NAT-10 [Callorhinchus milii]XP_007883584.1 arylamine N-acetyltransferase, pineal gland isozyme NAT-10 [Callorhinchus milii]|eukprot:gi/632989314/ref/XP_007883583.1/ PREDICTED: arylamine N-acetyltransferase 1 [Callorhinchus milii]